MTKKSRVKGSLSEKDPRTGRAVDKLAGTVHVELEREADGRHLADIPSVPGAMAYGESPGQAVDAAMSIAQNAEAPPEQVRHPAHYGGADDPYEAIKVIEAWGVGFNVGSALKYVRRAGRKIGDSLIVDLEKAVFYLDREIQLARGHRPAEQVRGKVGAFGHIEHRLVTAERTVSTLARQNEELRAALAAATKPAPKRARKGARR